MLEREVLLRARVSGRDFREMVEPRQDAEGGSTGMEKRKGSSKGRARLCTVGLGAQTMEGHHRGAAGEKSVHWLWSPSVCWRHWQPQVVSMADVGS